MGDQHEHGALVNAEQRLRKHTVSWGNFSAQGVQQQTQSLLDRFATDYKQRSSDGDKTWCLMLDQEESAIAIAEGLMACLSSQSISKSDQTYIVLMLDDLVQDDRKRVALFRMDGQLDNNLEILMTMLDNLGENSSNADDDLLNQHLMHFISVLFYPGLGHGQAVSTSSQHLDKFASVCRDRLAYENTSLKHMLHALSALQVLLREHDIRAHLNETLGFHRHCAKLLHADSKILQTHQNNNQLLYQLSFCLWLLSYDEAIAEALSDTEVVHNMLRVMRDVTKEKVLRMCVACFRNLVDKADHNEQMIEQGALKQLVVLRNKTWSDDEVVDDLQVVADALAKSVKILSSVDKYRAEVKTGTLDWTPVHKSESFFREHAEKFAPLGKPMTEFDDLNLLCKLLRDKVSMLHPSAEDNRTIAVICHDLGEFARWHPRGKKILNEDSALYNDGLKSTKSIIMAQMTESQDTEISKNALTCIHKMMVTNWQFLEPAR
jgi:V-type H+-transporting ATPase subunit H